MSDMDSQSLNMKQSRIKRVVTTLSMVVANKDQDPLARQKYDKVKRILGIDDKQLGEFANFQKNEKKLLKVFGTFMDHEIQTGEPIDLLSALQVVREAPKWEEEKKNVSDEKIKSRLGITQQNLEAYRSFQTRMPKLERIFGEFIQIDNPEALSKLNHLEQVIFLDEDE